MTGCAMRRLLDEFTAGGSDLLPTRRTRDGGIDTAAGARFSKECRLRLVDAAAEPLVAEAAHLLDDGKERAAFLRQGVLDTRR
jgi:hypothetical protein